MNWIFSLYLLIDVDSRLIFVKFGGVFLLVVENCRGMDLAATLDCGQAFRWKATLQGWHGIVVTERFSTMPCQPCKVAFHRNA